MKADKYLEGKGEVDYDFKNDILFFKTMGREYLRSIEIDNLVLDVDSEGFIVGVQIFEASEFLNIDKKMLRDVLNWEFSTKTDTDKENGKDVTKIELRLKFQVRVRNKIIEMNPIIMPHPINDVLPNSELSCVA